MKSISRSILFAVLAIPSYCCVAADWWTISDKEFAEQYAKQATGDVIKDQSSVAWMLFARVNQPKQNLGQTVSEWEMWPSNDDTFSPAVGLFKLSSKILTRPHLQPPKVSRINEPMKGVHMFSLPPGGGGEEVTRNMDSYNYIIQNGLQTQAGVKKFLASPNPKVDVPVGAVEIKAVWVTGKTEGAYQFNGSTGTYSLLGLHIMAKVLPSPSDQFASESPSWFWTTFEFEGNPGLKNAQSLLTYKDELPPAEAMNLLTQAGLDKTAFKNYKCNGTQIRFSDGKNPKILLGNTKMETFGFTPASAPDPSKWKGWNVSCHTCHGTSAASLKDADLFFPFSGVQINEGGGPIPTGQMEGYQSLDFIWSIAFWAR